MLSVMMCLAAVVRDELANQEFDREVLDEHLAMGHKKRLRLDEDFVAEVHKRVANGDVATCSAVVRVSERLPTKTAENLVGRFLNTYMAAGWLTMKGGDLGLALDASRVGNPAQETLVLCAWHPGSGRAMALPVQVCLGGQSRMHQSIW